MKMATGILGVGLATLACSGSVWAQSVPVDGKQPEGVSAKPRADVPPLVVQTFHLDNISQTIDRDEIYNSLRNLLPPTLKIYLVPSQNTIFVEGTQEQIALTQKMLHELDHPKKLYRLTYTITEIEGGKKTSSQHFSMVAEDGQRVTLKQGSKVPIATGSSTATGNSGVQTQFQYLDVGMNFDATLTSVAGGGVLKSKVEQTSVAETTTIADVREPIIRQASVEGTSVLTLGKPLLLGSIDVTGSTRHLDVEVLMELVK